VGLGVAGLSIVIGLGSTVGAAVTVPDGEGAAAGATAQPVIDKTARVAAAAR
jgi:hypothetical protein